MARYLRLLLVQLRASMLLALQYRVDFAINSFMALFWTATAIVPLFVLYQNRATVAGWTWPEALLVVAFFTILKGVLDGGIQPALQSVVEHVRKGTLDFVLMKPADAQFLVSTTGIELWRGAEWFSGLFILVYAIKLNGKLPSVGSMVTACMLMVLASVILYSILILVISLAFSFVKVDNLTYLFSSLYDAARWPSTIFRGTLALFFTCILPLAVMTTYPALALLSRLALGQFLWAAFVSVLFFVVSRLVWLRSIGRYTSAGG